MARAQKSWHTSSRFVVAVDGLPRVTAAYIQSETTFGGVPHHFLLGGINGMLHVHSLTGRLILEHETEGASPITAITEKRHRCALIRQSTYSSLSMRSCVTHHCARPPWHDLWGAARPSSVLLHEAIHCVITDSDERLCSSNSTHVITGHADGCVRWHILKYSLYPKSVQDATIRQVQNNTFCPDAAGSASPDASIKLLSVGRMYQQHQKLAAVAVTEGNDVLMLRDAARKPVVASSAHNILHVYFENRQVRPVRCPCRDLLSVCVCTPAAPHACTCHPPLTLQWRKQGAVRMACMHCPSSVHEHCGDKVGLPWHGLRFKRVLNTLKMKHS